MTHPSRNLLADGIPETRLAEDPAAGALATGGHPVDIAADHPASSLAWAVLAEAALASGARAEDVAAYAYARVGYHRGLDALRRAGWRGQGPIPFEHVPNQGFLRALRALAVAAERIGEPEEAERCWTFLRDSSPAAYQELGPRS